MSGCRGRRGRGVEGWLDTFDEIARRHAAGQGTLEIQRALGVRREVVSRVRSALREAEGRNCARCGSSPENGAQAFRKYQDGAA